MEEKHKAAAEACAQAVKKLIRIRSRSPRELYDSLGQAGYVGQESTRRSLCLMAYRHVRRLKDKWLGVVPYQQLSPKSNVLVIGPTGCGKTHLAELLFGQLIGVPVTTVDATGFTKSGYVGRSVSEILGQLVEAAGGNPIWATMGICILDEFDKLAGATSNARFAGEGTTKDVSGYGVQRELIRMIEGGLHPVAWGERFFPGTMMPTMTTDDIGFVACGAFSGIKELAVLEKGGNFGFKPANSKSGQAGLAYSLAESDIASVEVFQRYGFLPELIGRFTSIIRLAPLDRRVLREILIRNVIPRFAAEFEREGLKLPVPGKLINQMVKDATECKTGARGLVLQLTQHLEEQAFESFGRQPSQNERVA